MNMEVIQGMILKRQHPAKYAIQNSLNIEMVFVSRAHSLMLVYIFIYVIL